ncbi:MAG: hypothetical protein AABX65_02275, partial [Nanoarchaeota archaeon]
EKNIKKAIERITFLKEKFSEDEITNFLYAMDEMNRLIEIGGNIKYMFLPHSERNFFWDGRTYEQIFLDCKKIETPPSSPFENSVETLPPNTATYQFSTGNESFIPIIPQEDAPITYTDLLTKSTHGRILDYEEWCEIIMGEASQKSENLTPLDKLQRSLINYLNKLSKTREQITSHINANLPWREYIAPDKYTGGKPAMIEIKPGQLDLIQNIDPNKKYEDVHYRIVVDIEPEKHYSKDSITLETKVK